MPAWPDAEIAEMAARQRALITHRQLHALGVSSSAIGRAIARGRLHPIHRGVYALVGRHALPALALGQAALLAAVHGRSSATPPRRRCGACAHPGRAWSP